MKNIKKLLIISMALLVLFGFSVSAFATELDHALKEKEKLESQLNDTKDEINDLQDTKDELEDYVENLDAKLSEATNSISKLESQLNEKKTLLEEEKKKIVVVALVDTLEYLKRGGRISKAVAFAGGVLNIKPVLSVIDGEIRLLGKARGSKMGNNLLVQEIDKAGGIDFERPVLLGYSGISDALLLKYIEDSRHIWEGRLKEVRYTTVGSVIGTHVGPGAVVVAFFKK